MKDQTGTAWIVGLLGGFALTMSGVAAFGNPFDAPEAHAAPLPVIDADAYTTKALRYLYQQDAHQPDGAVVFLGDSLTEGLAVAAVSPLAVNYGVAHMTADRLQVAVRQLQAVNRASVVVLMIGTNDVARGSDPLPGLRALAGIDAPLIWHAIPPANGVEPVAVNAEIRALCEARPDCAFVQTAFVPADFTDGTHLSEAGYGKLIATLRAAF